MRVAPGGSPAPQSQDSQPPGQQQQQQGPSPSQAIQMIEQGFTILGKILQSAGQSLPPDDIKLFQQAAQATDVMIQSLTGPAEGEGGQSPNPPSPSGPMPAHASPSSQGMGA